MRRLFMLVVSGILAVGTIAPSVATAAPATPPQDRDWCTHPTPTASWSIKNIEILCRIPTVRHTWNNTTGLLNTSATTPSGYAETQTQVISINFIDYGNPRPDQPPTAATRDVMFVSGRFGLKSFDITNPLEPKLLDWLGDGINDPNLPDGHPGGATPNLMARQGLLDDMWENEDMDVDQDRKLVFLSRDPRAYPGTAVGGSNTNPNHIAGVYVIDVRHPDKLNPISFVRLPGGHTTTCINDCKWLWTGGPAATTTQRAELGWNGRPIFVTDMRDPYKPVAYEQPVDLSRNHGTTDYAHDVQVDAAGIAWVSGNGGVRGYWTKGRQWDPVLGAYRVATAFDPVPYAGGALQQSTVPIRNTAHPGGSRFMHNAWRPLGADAPDPSYGNLIYTTEEAINGANNALGYNACQNDGPLIIASLDNSYGGQAWNSTVANKFELNTVATWHPFGKEGSSTSTDCSAHYFQIKDRILSMSFYSQGARFLDISNPTQPTQIAYFRPGTATWATYPHKGLYYSADSQGVYVLRLTVKAGQLAASAEGGLAAAAVDVVEADAALELRASLARPAGSICSIPIDFED